MPHVRMHLIVTAQINKIALLEIFFRKKSGILWKTILSAIFITGSVRFVVSACFFFEKYNYE
jgi:hypothetical protein